MNSYSLSGWLYQFVVIAMTIQSALSAGGRTGAVGAAPTHTNYYVRSDGGTRFSTNVPTGQCNGKFNASYASTGGSGVNQNCAWNDVRYPWDDDSGVVGAGAWVL